MKNPNFQQKTTKTGYKFRPFSQSGHSPAAAKKRAAAGTEGVAIRSTTYTFRQSMLLQDSQKCKHFYKSCQGVHPLGSSSQRYRTRKVGPLSLLRRTCL